MSELRKSFDKAKSDKGSKHSYEKAYEENFEPLRNEPINILEIGIFRGESLAAWVDYFPNAQVYGLDTFQRIAPKDIDILNHERVHWLKGDSQTLNTKHKIKEKWPDVQFDIIIDDGLHTPAANGATFENLIEFMKDDGQYFVEDVWPLDIMTQKEWQNPWVVKRPKKYTLLNWERYAAAIDGYKQKRYDLRNPHGDSYIMRMTK